MVGRHHQQGQATVELALALPVVVLALLLAIQVALVARAQVLTVDSAREGARAEAVRAGSGEAAARATPGLDVGRLSVEVGQGPSAQTVAVTVRYRAVTDVPLVGRLVGDPELEATVVMRAEREEG